MTDAFLHHGGRVAHAARHFGGNPADWLDLSTGLNPSPWPVGTMRATQWHALPDPDALAGLEHAAARFFGADPALVCAVPGSEMALRMLAPMLGLPGRALAPSYRTHAEAFASSRPIVFGDEPQPRETVVLANPNNPDGLLRSPAALREWHARIAASQGWLIVDEAFADCHPHASVAPDVGKDARLVVLRSFGKFFGLAGVRLGFVVAPSALAMRLRALLGSWPVHAGALAIGHAAYADSEWIAQTRAHLPRRAAALDAVLQRRGLKVEGACPLFRYVTGCDAKALFARLASARILVRAFAGRADALRLGVPALAADRDRLDRALADA